jgi:hypothetical protein
MQRGPVRTLATSPNIAFDRASRSAIFENDAGDRNDEGVCAATGNGWSAFVSTEADKRAAIEGTRMDRPYCLAVMIITLGASSASSGSRCDRRERRAFTCARKASRQLFQLQLS